MSRTTLYELVKQGDLVKVNIGRRGLITTESAAANRNLTPDAYPEGTKSFPFNEWNMAFQRLRSN